MYFALDSRDFEDSVKRNMLAEYRRMKYDRCTGGEAPPTFWLLQRGCCRACLDYDALLPGTYKVSLACITTDITPSDNSHFGTFWDTFAALIDY